MDKIRAIIEVARDDRLRYCYVADFNPIEQKIKTYSLIVMEIDGQPFLDHDFTIHWRQYHGSTTGVNSCRFLEVLGHEFKKGNLLDIDFIED